MGIAAAGAVALAASGTTEAAGMDSIPAEYGRLVGIAGTGSVVTAFFESDDGTISLVSISFGLFANGIATKLLFRLPRT